MPDLKLSSLPKRTPVKLTISVSPDLYQALGDYAVLYAQAYGQEEPVTELVPAMLKAFRRVIGRSSPRGSWEPDHERARTSPRGFGPQTDSLSR